MYTYSRNTPLSIIIEDCWSQNISCEETLDVAHRVGYNEISLQYVKQEFARLELDYKIIWEFV